MAYEHEYEEWRCDVASQTEMDRVSGPRIVGGAYRMGEASDALPSNDYETGEPA